MLIYSWNLSDIGTPNVNIDGVIGKKLKYIFKRKNCPLQSEARLLQRNKKISPSSSSSKQVIQSYKIPGSKYLKCFFTIGGFRRCAGDPENPHAAAIFDMV